MIVLLVLLWALQDMDALVRDFKSDDAEVRDRAVQSALTRAAEWTPKDLDALRGLAAAGDRDVAPRAKETLERIEIRRKAGPALVARFKGLDTLIRRGEREPCVALLKEVNGDLLEGQLKLADLDVLITLMMARGVDLETDVFQLTFDTDFHQPYARVLRRMLKGEDEQTVAAAIMRLMRVGGKGEVPLILPFLKSESTVIRQCAASAFTEIPDRAVLEPILPLLRDPQPDVRRAVLESLGKLPARDCAVAVVPLLKDEDSGVRHDALDCLAKMGALAHAGAVADLLRDPEVFVRKKAAWALSMLDADAHAQDVVPLLNHENADLRFQAGCTLARLDSAEAIRRCKPLLDRPESNWQESWDPFQHPEARSEAGTVAAFLKHADPDLRGRAAYTLSVLGASDRAAEIAALLKDPDEHVCASAAEALGDLAILLAKIDPAWPARVRELENARPKNKWPLSVALLRLGGKPRDAQRDLARRMVEHRTYETTQHYANLFRGLGEVNEPAAAAAMRRRWKLEKPIATRADLEALFAARGLKLSGATGWDIHGRTSAGRDVNLLELVERHFDESWHPVLEKDVVQLLWWDKAFDYWLKRLK